MFYNPFNILKDKIILSGVIFVTQDPMVQYVELYVLDKNLN